MAAALLGSLVWVGSASVRADLSPTSLARANVGDVGPLSAGSVTNRSGSSTFGHPTPAHPAEPLTTTTADVQSATAASSKTPSAPPPSPPTTAPTSQAGYDAGGAASSSSSVGEVYAQTTQPGWGCQAALQYLAQNANPEFSLVCPGYAFGHQAMTCYHEPGACDDSAEIVIADPCPAAYKNEAWNSWHIPSGPFDPYGWCGDWNNRQGPTQPAPSLIASGPQPAFIRVGG